MSYPEPDLSWMYQQPEEEKSPEQAAVDAARDARTRYRDGKHGYLEVREAERLANRLGADMRPRDQVGTPEVRRAVRESVGWSIEEVANATGLTVGAVARYERDRDPASDWTAKVYREWLKEALATVSFEGGEQA